MASQVPDEQPTSSTTPSRTPNRKVFVFILVRAFLNTMGFGLIESQYPTIGELILSNERLLSTQELA